MNICISLKKTSTKSLTLAQSKADLVELYLDQNAPQAHTLLSQKKIPFIYKYQGNSAVLAQALKAKIDYIDFDIITPQSLINLTKQSSPSTKIIISFHDYHSTPSIQNLQKIHTQILQKKPDIIKIVTTATNLIDSLKIFKLLKYKPDIPLIAIAMGPQGQITRTAGHLFGNYLTFAPLHQDQKTAPGQLTYDQLQKICL